MNNIIFFDIQIYVHGSLLTYHREECREVLDVCEQLADDRLQLRVVGLVSAVRNHVLHDVSQESVHLRLLVTTQSTGET